MKPLLKKSLTLICAGLFMSNVFAVDAVSEYSKEGNQVSDQKEGYKKKAGCGCEKLKSNRQKASDKVPNKVPQPEENLTKH